MKPPTDLDNFYYIVAMNLEAPTLCSRINPRANGDVGRSAAAGYQVRTLRSSCYRNLAEMLHNPSLCNQVIPVRTDTLDGSKLNKASCLAEEDFVQTIAVPAPFQMDSFVRLMRRIGYGDQEVAEAEYTDHNPLNSPTCAAYKRLRDDPVLLERLHAAPSYAEPRSRSGIRAANPLEFLFQMVAVDRPDAELCAKVSPNATFADTGGKTAVLQSRCYLSIAFNTRDASLCERLPRTGAFPFVNDLYDSLERCTVWRRL